MKNIKAAQHPAEAGNQRAVTVPKQRLDSLDGHVGNLFGHRSVLRGKHAHLVTELNELARVCGRDVADAAGVGRKSGGDDSDFHVGL